MGGHGLQDRGRHDHDQAEATEDRRDDRAAGLAGVVVGGADADQHDDEEEEHHNRTGVHDDLRDTQEGGAIGDVQDRQAEHDADHADDRVRGLLHEEDTQGAATMTMAVHAKRMISPVDPIMGPTVGQVHQCVSFATRTVLREGSSGRRAATQSTWVAVGPVTSPR